MQSQAQFTTQKTPKLLLILADKISIELMIYWVNLLIQTVTVTPMRCLKARLKVL